MVKGMRDNFKKLILNDKPTPLPEGAISVLFLKPHGGWYHYLPLEFDTPVPTRTRIRLNNSNLERRLELGLSCVDIQTLIDLEDEVRAWDGLKAGIQRAVWGIKYNFKWLFKFRSVLSTIDDLKGIVLNILRYVYFTALSLTPKEQELKRKAKAAQAFIDNSYFIEVQE